MSRYPFEIWANSRWDGEPFRIGRYASISDAEKAMAQWPDMDCWIVDLVARGAESREKGADDG